MAQAPALPVFNTPIATDERFPADLEGAIRDLLRERNAVFLAHYYQDSEIQDLADFVGDSLQLAQAAQKLFFRPCELKAASLNRQNLFHVAANEPADLSSRSIRHCSSLRALVV